MSDKGQLFSKTEDPGVSESEKMSRRVLSVRIIQRRESYLCSHTTNRGTGSYMLDRGLERDTVLSEIR